MFKPPWNKYHAGNCFLQDFSRMYCWINRGGFGSGGDASEAWAHCPYSGSSPPAVAHLLCALIPPASSLLHFLMAANIIHYGMEWKCFVQVIKFGKCYRDPCRSPWTAAISRPYCSSSAWGTFKATARRKSSKQFVSCKSVPRLFTRKAASVFDIINSKDRCSTPPTKKKRSRSSR